MIGFIDNASFYPTPINIIIRMVAKIKGCPKKILEPSAGKGDIVEYMKSHSSLRYSGSDISVIEKDEDLMATLRGKKIKVIDSDFLTFSGLDKFDLIIANPPFDNGHRHLLKALDIMYRGQIIFLLNAETLKNPYSNSRKELVRRLEELGAEIEYIKDAFIDAERKTKVEIALINLVIKRNVEEDLFSGAGDKAQETTLEFEEKYEVSTGRTVQDLIDEYNGVVRIAIETIVGYFKNYRKIDKYLILTDSTHDRISSIRNKDMTTEMQDLLNSTLVNIRKDFWRRTINIDEVRSRMTQKKQNEFEHQLNERSHMDFTANNVRSFILNIINSYEDTLTEAVLDIFEKFTIKHSYSGGLYEQNIHYYDGWKTNKAYKVGKRVIIPIRGGYGGPFFEWGSWRLNYEAARTLDDIDKVMNYFDGKKEYKSISTAIEEAFKQDIHSCIESTYFRITPHKKGTIHLTFKDSGILRRFNTTACKGKNWLPDIYGQKPYKDMDFEEKAIVDSFEGEKSYTKNFSQPLFQGQENRLKIAA